MSYEIISKNCYLIPKFGNMRVDAHLYINDLLLQHVEEMAIKQLMDAASLPGVFGQVLGMPDIHTGYGLPIGGVMAMDSQNGLISAGAVGMDINCGVRLLQTPIPYQGVSKKLLHKLIKEIVIKIPIGVGQTNQLGLNQKDLTSIMTDGLKYLANKGMATNMDLDRTEENGFFNNADPEKASKKARDRGFNQLGTLGGGNHFIEIGYIGKIYDLKRANHYGLKEGHLSVLIHTGSRAFGHQICTDHSQQMIKAATQYGIDLPSKGLAAVPIDSQEGKDYFQAMAAAINYAFANRQIMTHLIRECFEDHFGSEGRMNLIYDVAHNIAKFEEHFGEKVLVHRKGATRALPANDSANPACFRQVGHPAIIPGSMGNPSYVMVGLDGIEDTFKSINHGAGRLLSRKAARNQIPVAEMQKEIGDVIVNTSKWKKILDEAPQAYKDIDQVISAIEGTGKAKPVAQHVPLAVIKGED